MIESGENIETAWERLKQANDAHRKACADYEVAGRQRTSTVNTLNEAQKQFDAVMALIRKEAPRDTDWYAEYNARGVEKNVIA